MSAKSKLVEAAFLHEKSLALAEIAKAQAVLENIGSNSTDDYLQLFISHVKEAREHEQNMNAIQSYFTQPSPAPTEPAVKSPPASAPPPAEPKEKIEIGHDELMKRSSTYRESLKGKFNEKK